MDLQLIMFVTVTTAGRRKISSAMSLAWNVG